MIWITALLLGQLAHADAPSVTSYISSTPYITATYYSDEENHLAQLIKAHFDMAKNCWEQEHMPSQRTIRGMVRGAIMGYRQFWPMRYDHAVDCFGYAISETGGNIIDNGKEAGCTGLWIDMGMDACDFYGIPCPSHRYEFKEKLKADPAWCTYITYASLAMENTRMAGNILRAVASVKFGEAGFKARLDRENKKLAKNRVPISQWEFVDNWTRQRHWLFCLDEHLRINCGNLCNECFPLISSK